jgi:hypothetical protein
VLAPVSTIGDMSAPATIAIGLIGVVAAFQILLALGVPWGAAAWGGRHPGVLPSRLRVASAASAVALIGIAWLVAEKGSNTADEPSWLNVALWIVAGYFATGVILNLISRSKIERIWSPVALVTAIMVAQVAAA